MKEGVFWTSRIVIFARRVIDPPWAYKAQGASKHPYPELRALHGALLMGDPLTIQWVQTLVAKDYMRFTFEETLGSSGFEACIKQMHGRLMLANGAFQQKGIPVDSYSEVCNPLLTVIPPHERKRAFGFLKTWVGSLPLQDHRFQFAVEFKRYIAFHPCPQDNADVLLLFFKGKELDIHLNHVDIRPAQQGEPFIVASRV